MTDDCSTKKFEAHRDALHVKRVMQRGRKKSEIEAAERRGMRIAAAIANAAYERWRKFDEDAAVAAAMIIRDDILEAADAKIDTLQK